MGKKYFRNMVLNNHMITAVAAVFHVVDIVFFFR